MPSSNKERLYVALYTHEGKPPTEQPQDAYHWALVTCAKNETDERQNRRFHVHQKIELGSDSAADKTTWKYESLWTSDSPTSMMYARVLIAKVKDMGRLEAILRSVPVRGEEKGWNSVSWVKDAVELALKDKQALSTEDHVNWTRIHNDALGFVAAVEAGRLAEGAAYCMGQVPTYDLLKCQQVQA